MDDAEKLRSLKTMAMVVYILQALGFFNGITWIVGVIIDYVKKDEAAGTWLESHYRWQIRTFWWGLCWSILGFITIWILVGFPILFATAVWMIYRLVKGWLNWSERKPMAV